MAATTGDELEPLIIRLIGDGSDYQKMLTEAVGQTRKSTGEIESLSEKIEGFGHKMAGFGERLEAGFAAFGIEHYLERSFEEFAELQTTMIKLDAIMEVNGRNVQTLGKQYQEFAERMEKIAVIAKPVTLSLLQQAEAFGVTGAAAERAAQNAITMQKQFGLSAQAAIRQTSGLEEGHVGMLQRFMPVLRSVQGESNKVAKAQELLGNMFITVEAQAKGVQGQIDAMKISWQKFREEIGEMAAPAIMRETALLKELADQLRELPGPVKEGGVVFAQLGTAILGARALLGISWPVAGILAYVAALGSLMRILYKLTPPVKDLDKALEEQEKQLSLIAAKDRKHIQSIIAEADKLGNVPRKIKLFQGLEEEASRINNMAQRAQNLRNQIKHWTEVDKGINVSSTESAIRKAMVAAGESGLAPEGIKAKIADLAILDKQITELTENYNKLNEEYKKDASEIANNMLQERINKIDQEIEVIDMDADHQLLYQNQLRASAEMVDKFNEALTRLQIAKDWKKAGDELRAFAHELQNTIPSTNEFGEELDAESKKLQDFITQLAKPGTSGMTEQQRMWIDGWTDAAGKVHYGIVQIINAMDKQKEKAKELSDAKKFMEEFGTGEERLADKIAMANKLMDKGVISVLAYSKALQEYEKQAHGTIPTPEPGLRGGTPQAALKIKQDLDLILLQSKGFRDYTQQKQKETTEAGVRGGTPSAEVKVQQEANKILRDILNTLQGKPGESILGEHPYFPTGTEAAKEKPTGPREVPEEVKRALKFESPEAKPRSLSELPKEIQSALQFTQPKFPHAPEPEVDTRSLRNQDKYPHASERGKYSDFRTFQEKYPHAREGGQVPGSLAEKYPHVKEQTDILKQMATTLKDISDNTKEQGTQIQFSDSGLE